jgi:hypothetical protein
MALGQHRASFGPYAVQAFAALTMLGESVPGKGVGAGPDLRNGGSGGAGGAAAAAFGQLAGAVRQFGHEVCPRLVRQA